MNAEEFNKLLTPVSQESVSGENCEYDELYLALDELALGTEESEMGDSVIEGKDPDYRTLYKNTLSLWLKTRDLRVASFFTLSSLCLFGLDGLKDGLSLIEYLVIMDGVDENVASGYQKRMPDNYISQRDIFKLVIASISKVSLILSSMPLFFKALKSNTISSIKLEGDEEVKVIKKQASFFRSKTSGSTVIHVENDVPIVANEDEDKPDGDPVASKDQEKPKGGTVASEEQEKPKGDTVVSEEKDKSKDTLVIKVAAQTCATVASIAVKSAFVSSSLAATVTNYDKKDFTGNKTVSPTNDETSLESRESTGVDNDSSLAKDDVAAQKGEVDAAETEGKAATTEATAADSGASALKTKAGATDIATKGIKLN